MSRDFSEVPGTVGHRHVALAALIACCGLAATDGGAQTATAAASATGPEPVALERLTLQGAESLFMERNRELQLARRAVEGSEADVLAANARPNPTVSVGTTQISPSQGVGSGSLWTKGVDTAIGVSQLFERGNKRELRKDVAEANAAASRSDRGDIERQQRVALHAAYYDLLGAQDRLAIVAGTATAYQRTLDAAQLRLKAGDIAATDFARLSVDALRAQNDSRVAQAELARARLALGYLIGAEREASRIRAVDGWPAVEATQPPPAVDAIVDARADVRAARARVEAADRGAALANALRTRDITAGVQYERFPGDTANNSYGVFVSVPLFTNYYYEGEIRKAEVELAAERDNLDRVRGLAIADIARSRADLDSAAERVTRSREAVLTAAERAATGAEFAYSRGAIGVTDLLDARRQFYAARLEAVLVQADYAKALSAWRAAIATEAAP